jgi:RNA polymerase sigma-70 factor (ECF subfamily)
MQGVRVNAAVGETSVAHSFAAFYRQHYGAVLGFAIRRFDDEETAREIALDVFRIAWRNYNPQAEATRAWLLQVARNQIGDAYRRRDRDRRLRTALQTEAALPGSSTPDDRVREVLDLLPAATREVLVLTYWDQLPAAEVGRHLGCSTAAVWVRLHRARAAFAIAWTGATK